MSTASEVARSGPLALPRICCVDLDTLSPTSSELELYPVVKEMLTLARTRPLAVRLLGMQLSNLGVFEQLSLFDQHEKVGAVVDGIRARFGFSMVTLATQLGGAGKTLVGRQRVGRSR